MKTTITLLDITVYEVHVCEYLNVDSERNQQKATSGRRESEKEERYLLSLHSPASRNLSSEGCHKLTRIQLLGLYFNGITKFKLLLP